MSENKPETTGSVIGGCKRFECKVIGLPRPSVRWYKDGANITTETRYKFEYAPDGSVVLILDSVTHGDQGVYQCRAQNSEGSAVTSAQLYVKDTISNRDEEVTSVHTMSFLSTKNDDQLTSKSQKRPLIFGPGDNGPKAKASTSDDSVQTNEGLYGTKWSRTKELEARVLAGKYLFDTGPVLGEADQVKQALTLVEFVNQSEEFLSLAVVSASCGHIKTSDDILVIKSDISRPQTTCNASAVDIENDEAPNVGLGQSRDIIKLNELEGTVRATTEHVLTEAHTSITQSEYQTTETSSGVNGKNENTTLEILNEMEVTRREKTSANTMESAINTTESSSKQNVALGQLSDINKSDELEGNMKANTEHVLIEKQTNITQSQYQTEELSSEINDENENTSTEILGEIEVTSRKNTTASMMESAINTENIAYQNVAQSRLDDPITSNLLEEFDNDVKKGHISEIQSEFQAAILQDRVNDRSENNTQESINEREVSTSENTTESQISYNEQSVFEAKQTDDTDEPDAAFKIIADDLKAKFVNNSLNTKELHEQIDDCNKTHQYGQNTESTLTEDLNKDTIITKIEVQEKLPLLQSYEVGKNEANENANSDIDTSPIERTKVDQNEDTQSEPLNNTSKKDYSLNEDDALGKSNVDKSIHDVNVDKCNDAKEDDTTEEINDSGQLRDKNGAVQDGYRGEKDNLEIMDIIDDFETPVVNDVHKTDTKQKTIPERDMLITSDEDNTSSTDDESIEFDLDIDRKEETISSRTKQFRRLSAQDNVTKEMRDSLSVSEQLNVMNDDAALEQSRNKKQDYKIYQSEDNVDSDIGRKLETMIQTQNVLMVTNSQEQCFEIEKNHYTNIADISNEKRLDPVKADSSSEFSNVGIMMVTYEENTHPVANSKSNILEIPLKENYEEAETKEVDQNQLEIIQKVSVVFQEETRGDQDVNNACNSKKNELNKDKALYESDKIKHGDKDYFENGKTAIESAGSSERYHKGRMQREEEHPGLLDHAVKDDKDDRILAGKYLFFDALSQQGELSNRDCAHEFHYMHEAKRASETGTDKLHLQTVLKDTLSTLESCAYETEVSSKILLDSEVSISNAHLDQTDGVFTRTESELPEVITNTGQYEVVQDNTAELKTNATSTLTDNDVSAITVSRDIQSNSKILENDLIEKIISSVDCPKEDSLKPLKADDKMFASVTTNTQHADRCGEIAIAETVEYIEAESQLNATSISTTEDEISTTPASCDTQSISAEQVDDAEEIVKLDVDLTNADTMNVSSQANDETFASVTTKLQHAATSAGQTLEGNVKKIGEADSISTSNKRRMVFSIEDTDISVKVQRTEDESRSNEITETIEVSASTDISTASHTTGTVIDALVQTEIQTEKAQKEIVSNHIKEIIELDYADDAKSVALDLNIHHDYAVYENVDNGDFESNCSTTELCDQIKMFAAREGDVIDKNDTTASETCSLEEIHPEVPDMMTTESEIRDNKSAGNISVECVTDLMTVENELNGNTENTIPMETEKEPAIESNITPKLDYKSKSSCETSTVSNVNESQKEDIEIEEPMVISEQSLKECKIPDFDNLEQKPQQKSLEYVETETKIKIEKAMASSQLENVAKDSDINVEKTNDIQKASDDTSPMITKERHSAEIPIPTVEVLNGCSDVIIKEGDPIILRWKITGVSRTEIDVCKDGLTVQPGDGLTVKYDADICEVSTSTAGQSDGATYSVRVNNTKYDESEIIVQVVTSQCSTGDVPSQPVFVVEPTVDTTDGRRLSIKCSVTGFPLPEVKWYHHGQQLSRDALWDMYTQDGYHFLGVSDPSVLEGEQIECRVENEAGFLQSIISLKNGGEEPYCETELPEVAMETSHLPITAPRIHIEISESANNNLRLLTVDDTYTDENNSVTVDQGDVVELLSTVTFDSILVRQVQSSLKICYIPLDVLSSCMTETSDVSNQVCKNVGETHAGQVINKTTEKQETKALNNTETENSATMPERRKMKSPSPKMTSTPKMKRKDRDRESPTELQTRLGIKEKLTSKKDFSQDSIDLSDYNDGTTRPMFKKRLRNVSANSGELAQLECVVSGTPPPKVLWLKNNRPLKAADGCKVIVDEGTNILVFPSARDEDVGVYTARAMNVNGSVMATAEFTLNDGKGLSALSMTDSPLDMDFTTPTYFFQMSSCEVSEGRLARFDCRVVAYPKPEIVWMKDGKVVESDGRSKLLNFNNEIYSLLIQDVQSSDTGRYICWARNKFGEAMTEAYLNVIALTEQEEDGDLAPKFLTKFYDQQTTEGTATDFNCLVAGRPEPSVTWFLEDKELRDVPGTRLRRKDNTVSLEMKSPKVDQAGMYSCQLRNPLGEATCCAKLTVIEDKLHGKMLPKFLKKFDHVNARDGEEVKFTCIVIGEPKPEVTWMFDHKPVSDTNRRYVMKKEGDAFTLIIKNVRFDDGGTITCKATNTEGEVYCSGNLHVRESKFTPETAEKAGLRPKDDTGSKFGYVPTFTKRLHDMEVKEGSRAKFECQVMGIPEPEVSWMRDGRVITPGGRYHMTREGGTCRLTIDNTSPADTGVYTCIIANSQGKSSSTAELKLEGEKKERYTPEKFLDDKTFKKERYTPDKYLLDDSYTSPSKRPYLDIDRKEAKPARKRYQRSSSFDDSSLSRPKPSYESPVKSTYDDTSLSRPRKSYDIPVRSTYDDPSLTRPKRSYDSPVLSTYDDTSLSRPKKYEDKKHTRPRSMYDSPVRSVTFDEASLVRPRSSYESPKRSSAYDDSSLSRPKRSYDSPVMSSTYDDFSLTRPKRYDDMSLTRSRNMFGSPGRASSYDDASLTRPRKSYESQGHMYKSEDNSLHVPKIPFDRPTILNKRGDSVRLAWLPASTYDLPADARRISYVVESRELPHREWTKIATAVPSTSYMVKNLRPDKEYEFRVRVQNQHGVSEPTWISPLEKRADDMRRFVDLPEMRAPPRLPTHRPLITDLGEETVRLAWRPVETYQSKRSPPVSYRLEAKELPGKDWMPLSSRLRDTTHYLSELPHDRDYMIRVRAENDFGISEPTEPLWLPRAKAFPGVPVTRPEIIDYEANRAKLSWTRVDIPTFGLDDVPLTYMLEVEEPSQDWRTVARDLDDTEYIVEGLKLNRDYRFRVRAKTPTGLISEPSPAASLYTTLARTRSPVDRLEVLEYEPDMGSVHLSWQRVEIPPYNLNDEPLMYMLEYNEPPLPDWKPLVTGIPTTRYRVSHLDPTRDYNFRVRALTPYGMSPPSPALPVTLRKSSVVPALPESVIISEVEPDSVRLTWRRPLSYDLSTPISYQIEMLEPPMSEWRPVATGLSETTYKVTGLRPTKDYQFRVMPQVDSRFLAPTSVAALTSSAVKPRLPMSEPSLKEISPESVQLSWRPAEFPVYQRSRAPLYYGVQMMELPSSKWVPVARRVPDTTYTVTGLRPDRDYKFRILAETDVAASEPSLPASLYRKPAPRFQRNEPSIRDISPNVVHLTWQPADIADGYGDITYQVEIQTPPGISSWSTLYDRHPTASVRLADLRPDLDYLVRVRAQCGDHLTEPTLPVYIPRRAVPPRIPLDEPYAVEINSDSVKLQWRSADLPTHILDYAPVTYRLEACEQPGSNWVTVAHGIPHTDFKVTGLNPAKDYTFRVRAMNDYGMSDPTHGVSIPRRSVAPTLPRDEPLMYDIGSGSVRLTWRPATLPSHMQSQLPTTYTIYVQELPFKTWRPLVKKIPHTSYYVSGLRPDKDYNFRIQAENTFGSSRPTESVYLPKFTDLKRPISIPEVSDFDEDLTSVKLHWKPRGGSPFDKSPHKYLIETWEPMRREWKPVARQIPDTSYHMRGLPAAPDHLFRVRMETEQAGLSEPSHPVSVSRYNNYPRVPVYRPQLYEVDRDTVRLSWQPATYIPDGTQRRSFKYSIEQREIPDTHWHQIVSDLHDTNYKIRGLRPKSDYEFRVRTIVDGVASEPSFPVALYRRSVIPRVKLDIPEVDEIDDTSVSLRWNKVEIPSFTTTDEPLSFMIERQHLPHYQWEPVATNITDSKYTVRGLQPHQDYNFRVRGVYPSGYTEPSPYVPVYRRPIRPSVPIARTEIWEEEPYSARLRWHRAYIPSYYSSRPLRYRIEMQEAGVATESDWHPVATDITATDFTVPEVSPRKDYNFRIRAEMENGDLSDPTPPIQYYRSQVPMTREPFALAEYKPVEYDVTFANHPYIDYLTKYVPPRIPIDKPDMVVINPETVELSWKPARVPESIRHTSNLTYTIEVRTPPSFEWRELVSGMKVLNHTVKNLHPRIDYIFRVRAWNEYGCSEPSLPVSFYRPVQYEVEEEDDEAWEREWELRFGQQDGTEVPIEQVPPKLPIDTPRTVTQTTNSIWFTWLPARIPAYATQTPITYVVEIKEPPSTNWRRDVTGLLDCQYVREGLSDKQDYHIRVKAETEFGSSEPTLPIIIKRSTGSRPGSRMSSLERDKCNDVTMDTTYLETLTAGVPPRMTSNRPLSSNSAPDRLTISWSACRVPSYVKNSNVAYIIEKRELPGHIWSVLAKDIKTTKYDITGLNPDQDYMFRVRAKNDFGVSEPTLPLAIYRERDDYVPQKIRSRSGSRDSITALVSWRGRRSSSIDYGNMRIDTSDPGMEACQRDMIPMQPEYITTTYDTQYGVEGKKGKINLQVRGYPLPTVHWYSGEEKLKYGDKYNTFVTSQGGITLEIQNVGTDVVGQYKCYAENESGAAVKVVTFELAEPPTILEPLKEQLDVAYKTTTISCKVDAFPNPTIKWLKDWKPLTDSERVKMVHTKPHTYSLEIAEALTSDSGVYACTVENIAGKVTTVGKLTVEDSIPSFKEVVLKTTPIEDFYHVLGEIGRGRHGVVRRVTEMSTGKTYAANYIYVRNKAQKNYFMSEFEILRSLTQMDGVLRLQDAFETDRCLIFVTEILTAPDLFEKIIADGDWTEARLARVVKQLLTTLKELESLSILHLDIKPSNIRMCGPDDGDTKLINFALSRFLLPDEDIMHNYGTVGYASPEQITNDVLRENTDLWAVGVLTYVLLSGVAPFQGSTDVDILNKTLECQWSFGKKDFEKVSKEGQDFISKLLIKDPSQRLRVDDCLNHPWMSTESDTKLNTDKIKQLYSMEKLKRESNQVYTTAHLQSLRKVLHGTAALYQPAIDTDTGEIIFPDHDDYGDYLDEDAWYEWQLQYLDDPDSQEFPIQKKEFTIRESRHMAAGKAKEEEKDEQESGSSTCIMFRNKIQTQTFTVGEDATFTCTVVSPQEVPVVTWYRDEQLLSEAYRAEPSFDEETGVAKLKIVNSKDYDAAIYKCVARNKDGRVSCQARLLLGDKPGKPGRPLVTQTSGTEAFLTWTGPVSDGNSYILGYRVDYRKQDDSKWTKGPYVTEEYALLSGLVPNTSYTFRVSCHNKFGTSPFSWASLDAATLDTDAPGVTIAPYLQPLLQFTSFTKQQLILPAESRRPSLTVVEEAKILEADPADSYSISETIAKGSYGEYKLCTKTTTNQPCVMKIVPYNKDNHAVITGEFEILRSLRQINIITVLDSYMSGDNYYVVFERLSGLNILQYLCLQKSYKEELVAQIVRQILDALQYLQHYRIVHLNLQPSSVVMATRRRPHVKLRDFTLARKIEAENGEVVTPAGYPDFVAPEVIKGLPVDVSGDMWSLGALTFTLLSGVSPFGGKDLKQTLSNILFDRYNVSDLHDNVSKESIKFVSKMLSRLPKNRPDVNKCLDSRWLQLSDGMFKARNSHIFHTDKLRDFSQLYQDRRANTEYMTITAIPIADLPKPTPGPVVQPILTDKIANRHVIMLKQKSWLKSKSKSPVKTICQEKAVVEEESLLDKVVRKTENEMKSENEKNLVEAEKVETVVKVVETESVTENSQSKDATDRVNKTVGTSSSNVNQKKIESEQKAVSPKEKKSDVDKKILEKPATDKGSEGKVTSEDKLKKSSSPVKQTKHDKVLKETGIEKQTKQDTAETTDAKKSKSDEKEKKQMKFESTQDQKDTLPEVSKNAKTTQLKDEETKSPPSASAETKSVSKNQDKVLTAGTVEKESGSKNQDKVMTADIVEGTVEKVEKTSADTVEGSVEKAEKASAETKSGSKNQDKIMTADTVEDTVEKAEKEWADTKSGSKYQDKILTADIVEGNVEKSEETKSDSKNQDKKMAASTVEGTVERAEKASEETKSDSRNQDKNLTAGTVEGNVDNAAVSATGKSDSELPLHESQQITTGKEEVDLTSFQKDATSQDCTADMSPSKSKPDKEEILSKKPIYEKVETENTPQNESSKEIEMMKAIDTAKKHSMTQEEEGKGDVEHQDKALKTEQTTEDSSSNSLIQQKALDKKMNDSAQEVKEEVIKPVSKASEESTLLIKETNIDKSETDLNIKQTAETKIENIKTESEQLKDTDTKPIQMQQEVQEEAIKPVAKVSEESTISKKELETLQNEQIAEKKVENIKSGASTEQIDTDKKTVDAPQKVEEDLIKPNAKVSEESSLLTKECKLEKEETTLKIEQTTETNMENTDNKITTDTSQEVEENFTKPVSKISDEFAILSQETYEETLETVVKIEQTEKEVENIKNFSSEQQEGTENKVIETSQEIEEDVIKSVSKDTKETGESHQLENIEHMAEVTAENIKNDALKEIGKALERMDAVESSKLNVMEKERSPTLVQEVIQIEKKTAPSELIAGKVQSSFNDKGPALCEDQVQSSSSKYQDSETDKSADITESVKETKDTSNEKGSADKTGSEEQEQRVDPKHATKLEVVKKQESEMIKSLVDGSKTEESIVTVEKCNENIRKFQTAETSSEIAMTAVEGKNTDKTSNSENYSVVSNENSTPTKTEAQSKVIEMAMENIDENTGENVTTIVQTKIEETEDGKVTETTVTNTATKKVESSSEMSLTSLEENKITELTSEYIESLSKEKLANLIEANIIETSQETSDLNKVIETRYIIKEAQIENLNENTETSAACGKYLTGSSDGTEKGDKEKEEPDEEEIARQLENRGMDDALLFC